MTVCEQCGHTIQIGEWPMCPHGETRGSVIGDACDIWQENGFAEPQHFTSKEARRKAIEAAGLQEMIRHKPVPGTDKSPHTQSWDVGMVPEQMEATRKMLERMAQANQVVDEPFETPWAFTEFTIEPAGTFTVKAEA